DGTKDEVPVKVTVKEKDADKYTPTEKTQEVNKGETPNAKDSIGNVSDLPENATYEYKTPVDTNTAGEKDAIVVVTYPDGTKDEVPVKVIVKEKDADKYTPTEKTQEVNKGETPNAKDSIGNVSELPENATYEYKTPVDTNTAGEKDAIVVVTYPDGTKDEVPVKVTVKEKDADKYEPTAKTQEVNKGETPNAKDSIGNVSELPENATYEYKTPVDTNTAGEKDAIVVVTYPDGTKDEVPVKVIVKEKDADRITPTVPEKTEVGDVNNLTDEEKKAVKDKIEESNKDKFPPNTKVEVGSDGTATITYPDGSKDVIPGTDLVKPKTDKPTDADKYTPTAKTQEVNKGEQPNAKDSIGNVSELPENATYEYKTPVDTNTAGEKDAIVVVTYPDGTKDEVAVKVTVKEKDADKYTPTAKTQEVNKGETPNAKDSIGNVSELPENATYEYKTPVDTNTAGEKDAIVVVTYPDGTKDEVPVKVIVKEKDADRITPTVPEKTEVGDVNNLTDEEKKAVKDKIEESNKDKFPPNTKVEVGPDGTATITYPDGSKDVIPGTDLVKPKTDADRITPTVPEKTEVGDVNNLTDEEKKAVKDKIEESNKDKFPPNTKVEVGPDGTATITYPDGSKDVIPGTDLVKPKTDADKYTPTTKPETVEKGGKVDLTDNVNPIVDESGNPVEVTVKDVTPEGSIDTNTPGEYTGKVEVTYPDGSKEVVDVPVKVVDSRTDADKYTPTTKPETVEKGGKVDLTDNVNPIKDDKGNDVPVTVKDVTPEGSIDTNKPGEYTGKVEVTYPDGSKEVVDVPVKVVDSRTDAEKITPTVPEKTEVTDPSNLTPEEKQEVADKIKEANKDKFPEGTKVEVGNDGTATITYPDGSKDVIPGEDLVVAKGKGSASKKLSNTGETTTTSAAGLALLVLAGLLSRRRKNK
ncbi:LPXTG cell wall anchor domain-containing protein, partial [Gemella sp. GH3]|uniref:Rib/alpha-like domain-containing protein n=1 Tax=unclassified Gemella TaxID=2624949 RepID=UPI0015D0A2B6